MKLYATVENEKGKREGIGGNEYLDIDIRVGNKILAQLTVRDCGNDLPFDAVGLYDEKDRLMYHVQAGKGKSTAQK